MSASNFTTRFDSSKIYAFVAEDKLEYESFEEEVIDELKKNDYDIINEWTERERMDVKLLATKQVFSKNKWFYGKIEVLLVPGYYYGVQLDYYITRYDREDDELDNYYYKNFEEFIEELANSELDEEDEFYELKLKTLKEKIENDHDTLDDVIAEECNKLEEIFKKLTTPLKCVGVASNGEAFYIED